MENYKDYFKGWITDKGKEYTELRNLYEMADADFDNRFTDKPEEKDESSVGEGAGCASHPNNKLGSFAKHLANFTKNLETLDKNWTSYQKNDSLRKMAHLAKANLLLREGQYRGEHFLDPQEQYRQACIVLEQEYEPGKRDFLNLMLQLHLGKYFCATAKHNQRSDYLRALDEFTEIRRTLEDGADYRLNLWQTHIWLEANMQLGLTLRYLYRLKEAKLCFLHMLVQLTRLRSGHISINPDLDRYIADAKLPVDMTQRLSANDSIYDGYLVETLVQLGIAYQKSRDYDIAQDICAAVLKKDHNNIDAANNLGVCLRKQKVETSFLDHARKNRLSVSGNTDSAYFSQKYSEIFKNLGRRGNRFARLRSIKCKIHDSLSDKDALLQELRDMLDGNPSDHEVCLLQGLLLQAQGDLEASQEILIDLYKKAPRISKGTIGLKSYYNIADNLLRQGKFHDAKMFYIKIQEDCTKPVNICLARNEKDENSRLTAALRLEDLPPGDLLAEINEGWCLMNLGDYEGAKECYEAILSRYQEQPHRLIHTNKMKIYNNLGECLLHLASLSNDRKLLEEAGKILMQVLEEEEYNSTANRHLGYYYQLKSRRDEKNTKSDLWQAMEHFQQAQLYDPNDVYAHAGWVSAATEALQKADVFSSAERSDLIRRIENKLKYSSGSYPIKSCAKFASFIQKMEAAQKNGTYDKDRLDTMYRSLARIRVSEKEEGYGQFLHFMEDDVFRRLEATKRGRLLVALFHLYSQIIEIKDLCRFTPRTDVSGKEFLIPVHYTKLNTLKLLLGDSPTAPGKLRLWNTIYMNDSFEGECFMAMMELAEKMRIGLDRQDGSVRERMRKYFPYLGRQNSRNGSLSPINKNIYVTSFSEQTNDIYMWVPYGDDAKGCAITFSDDFFDIRKSKDDLTDVSCYSDMDYPLYKIQYLDENCLEKLREGKYDQICQGDGISKNILQILRIMEEIWETIYDLEERMNVNKADDGQDSSSGSLPETNLIQNFVSGCLNEIRFLIKGSEYAHEGEVRMFHYTYEPKIDTASFAIPRLYVEVDRRIQIKEVKLGSKISEAQANEIVSWLTKTNTVERITKSERHYK